MSDSMIERVARYLCHASVTEHELPGRDGSETQNYVDEMWPDCTNQARKLLTAMREPTDAMVDAGEATADTPCDCMYARDVFTAMIDAALARE